MDGVVIADCDTRDADIAGCGFETRNQYRNAIHEIGLKIWSYGWTCKKCHAILDGQQCFSCWRTLESLVHDLHSIIIKICADNKEAIHDYESTYRGLPISTNLSPRIETHDIGRAIWRLTFDCDNCDSKKVCDCCLKQLNTCLDRLYSVYKWSFNGNHSILKVVNRNYCCKQ